MTQLKPPYLEKADKRGDLQVWIVDGSYVRGHIDEEFTNFGQHYRYPYIPADELWIDREAEDDERRFFVDHLLVEHRLMAQGMPYERAIEAADREERLWGEERLVELLRGRAAAPIGELVKAVAAAATAFADGAPQSDDMTVLGIGLRSGK